MKAILFLLCAGWCLQVECGLLALVIWVAFANTRREWRLLAAAMARCAGRKGD